MLVISDDKRHLRCQSSSPSSDLCGSDELGLPEKDSLTPEIIFQGANFRPLDGTQKNGQTERSKYSWTATYYRAKWKMAECDWLGGWQTCLRVIVTTPGRQESSLVEIDIILTRVWGVGKKDTKTSAIRQHTSSVIYIKRTNCPLLCLMFYLHMLLFGEPFCYRQVFFVSNSALFCYTRNHTSYMFRLHGASTKYRCSPGLQCHFLHFTVHIRSQNMRLGIQGAFATAPWSRCTKCCDQHRLSRTKYSGGCSEQCM